MSLEQESIDSFANAAWPPPPVQTTHGSPSRLPDFVPLKNLSRWLIFWLILTTSTWDGVYVLIDRAKIPGALLFLASALASIFVVVLFSRWTALAYRDTGTISMEPMRTTPKGAVSSLFIPIVAVVRPLLIFQEMWSRTDPRCSPGAGSALVAIWWISFLTANLVAIRPSFHCSVVITAHSIAINNGVFKLLSTLTNRLRLVTVAVNILNCLLCCVVVGRLTARIHAVYDALAGHVGQNQVPPEIQ